MEQKRLELPYSWKGRRYWTPQEWAEIVSRLRADPTLTLYDLLVEEGEGREPNERRK